MGSNPPGPTPPQAEPCGGLIGGSASPAQPAPEPGPAGPAPPRGRSRRNLPRRERGGRRGRPGGRSRVDRPAVALAVTPARRRVSGRCDPRRTRRGHGPVPPRGAGPRR
ncbi:predicted protein [Streptomyces sp. C]|nr:predicted protein [Streptomyces sp. C]